MTGDDLELIGMLTAHIEGLGADRSGAAKDGDANAMGSSVCRH